MSNSHRFQRGLLFLVLCPVAFAISPPKFLSERLRGQPVEVREVEGIQDRVHDGKLYLHLKDFIALVLKNNTEINLARLDKKNWMTSEDDVWCVPELLIAARHYPLFPHKIASTLPRMDRRAYEAGMHGWTKH